MSLETPNTTDISNTTEVQSTEEVLKAFGIKVEEGVSNKEVAKVVFKLQENEKDRKTLQETIKMDNSTTKDEFINAFMGKNKELKNPPIIVTNPKETVNYTEPGEQLYTDNGGNKYSNDSNGNPTYYNEDTSGNVYSYNNSEKSNRVKIGRDENGKVQVN